MAQPQRQAAFFVRPDGAALLKAPPLTRSQRLAVFKRDKAVCQLCFCQVRFGGNTFSPFDSRPKPGHVDHIHARACGGQNDEENLRLLCISCNASKGAAHGG